MVLYIDTETYSEVPIARGLHLYHEHSEVLLCQWAEDDGPVHVERGVPDAFIDALRRADIIVAHNAAFERVLLERMGIVPRHDKRWRCTMALAEMHSLPGGLGVLSDLYRLPIGKAKDKAGRELIQLFCKPVRGARVYPEDRPQEWAAFVDYARLDVVAERELYRRLPQWNREAELPVWRMDQEINDRGMLIDIDLARGAVEAVAEDKKDAGRAVREATDGEIQSAGQVQAIIEYLRDTCGVSMPDLKKDTVERRLADPELPAAAREMLVLRQDGAGTSSAKYKTLLSSVCSDRRLRGALHYCAALRTLRWGGRRFQPQNLPRPSKKNKNLIDLGAQALTGGYAHLIFDSVAQIASDCLRGVVVAPYGKKLVSSDYSAIEGRVRRWLAGDEAGLQTYREIDQGTGADIYCRTYAQIFGTRAEDCSDDDRQLGKTLELAWGYGGGVGASVTFAAVYGIDLNALARNVSARIPQKALLQAEEWYNVCREQGRSTCGLSRETFIVCDAIKRLWRWANPETVQLWSDAENAFRAVLSGETSAVSLHKVTVERKGSWVRVRLPSGRFMCYPAARIVDGKITYRGVDARTKKWGDLTTYGGKLTENFTQAVSRDVMVNGMFNARAAGYGIILTVHDDVVCEVPDEPAYSAEHLSDTLTRPAPWMQGLPLAAKGFECYRWRKG